MNYMLPLYLDYLERPDIYEGLFYREVHVLGEITGLNDFISEESRSAPMKLKAAHKPRLKAAHKVKAVVKSKGGMSADILGWC